MRVVALVCSARERGNCYDLTEFMMKTLRTKGIETEIINAYDYEITPRSHCRYECFEAPKSCPIRDDVPEIWRRLKEAEGVVFAIPTYYGMPSALFRSLIESSRGLGLGNHRVQGPRKRLEGKGRPTPRRIERRGKKRPRNGLPTTSEGSYPQGALLVQRLRQHRI